MAPNTGRQFKHVFNEAQEQLRSVFGMELTELPQREKVTVSQKRAAQRSGTQSSSSTSKAYILTSTLPARFQQPNILPPAQIPSTAAEASYVGLVTFILALIYLSPAYTISESRLEKSLKRMNADNYVLNGEKTEKVLKRMEKEGYIIKCRERDGGGEETVDYVLGSRGKVEVGERGVAGLVRKVYGKRDTEAEELDRRLVRSLGDVVIEKKKKPAEEEFDGEEPAVDEVAQGEQEVEADAAEEVEEEDLTGRRARQKQTRRSSGRINARRRDEEEEESEEEEQDEDEEEEEEEEEEGEEDGDDDESE
ncbi:hypothetical protein ACLMJK_008773 [Lecanora helva]